jgi:hypothetical protein
MNATKFIFQLFCIHNPLKLVILTPHCSPYMPSTDYVNTSTNYVNTFVDYINISTNYAHTSDHYVTTFVDF